MADKRVLTFCVMAWLFYCILAYIFSFLWLPMIFRSNIPRMLIMVAFGCGYGWLLGKAMAKMYIDIKKKEEADADSDH